ncbi:TrmH family RNA methyltransferase [Ramlibacter sp.]|uniref:TrmH family RNA methyltransferase n=1 Tax=Ramlibacter sp. TaxID=1917967 RepID=UPI003D096628
MTAPAVQHVTSRDNPLLKDLRKLAQDSTAYRKRGRVWLEGDHLGRAAILRGVRPAIVVIAESAWPRFSGEFEHAAARAVVVADALFSTLSGLESPAPIGFVLDLPAPGEVAPETATVVLDGLQDAGNVGAILRSAAAFGFPQVIALKGTAALWSPKVLRAGMGAHFGLRLIEGAQAATVAGLKIPLIATSSHRGDFLHRTELPSPCAWLLGHEGHGVSAELAALATMHVRIAQPGGEESLNVAAAAAICLHASASHGL